MDDAKIAIREAWEKLEAATPPEMRARKLEFGKICQYWHDWYLQKPKDKGDRIRFLWKSLGIPHTAAYEAMSSYKISDPDYKIPVIAFTQEEIHRSETRASNEAELETLFLNCGFPFQIRQNCATKEYHFNVVFTALTKERVKELAKVFSEV